MRIIGLTGGIACGKSTISLTLKSLGATIIDGDQLSRALTQPGGLALPAIRAEFGSEVFHADGTLDRRGLAGRAFASAEKTELLNSVTHPAITALARKRVAEAEKNGYEIALLDAPVLFSSELLGDCRAVICVCAPRDQRMARLLSRDGIDLAEIERRMSAQPDEKYYRDNSDIIIENPDGCDPTEQCVRALEILKSGGGK